MKKRLFIALLIVLSISILTSCGKSVDSNFELSNKNDFNYGNSFDMGVSDGYVSENEGFAPESELKDFESITDSSTDIDSSNTDLAKRKMIKRVGMTVQTKSYDEFIQSVKTFIVESNGYIQNSVMYDSPSKYAARNATIIARIPAENLNGFTGNIYKKGTVTYYDEDLQDVTTQYVDIQSRIKSLEIELESLNELLLKATDLQYIISIHDRLTTVRYELESYQTSLKNYDELISYSTVTIRINEVEREIVVEKQGTWQEISTNLSNNFAEVGESFRRFFIDLVSFTPFLLIYLAVVVIIAIIIIVIIKKYKRKKINKDKKE